MLGEGHGKGAMERAVGDSQESSGPRWYSHGTWSSGQGEPSQEQVGADALDHSGLRKGWEQNLDGWILTDRRETQGSEHRVVFEYFYPAQQPASIPSFHSL